MEVFMRHVPDQVNEKQLKKALAPFLERVSVRTFACRKLPTKGNATLTIADAAKAQKFLDLYAGPTNGGPRTSNQIRLFGKLILFTRSRFTPDEFLLKSLQQESERPITVSESKNIQKTFDITSMSCGLWDYSVAGDPVFVKYFHDKCTGQVLFGHSSVKISLQSQGLGFSTREVHCDYFSVVGPIYYGNSAKPTVTLSLEVAPRIYESLIEDILQTMNLFGKRIKIPKKSRIGCLGQGFNAVTAMCFIYQFTLSNPGDIHEICHLKEEKQIPKLFPWVTRTIEPRQSFSEQASFFMLELVSEALPYRMKFQLQMLVWNGVLPPLKVAGLFAEVHRLLKRCGPLLAVKVIQKLADEVGYVGPETTESDFTIATLVGSISDIEKKVCHGSSLYDTNALRPNRGLIHKATVTPLGIYLSGPYWETKNRVLRKHAQYIDNFLRVDFADETGDAVTYDPRSSIDQIYHQRFKGVLNSGFVVGGQHFEFLGFSHSSLRSQSCWFMAPFTTDDGEFLNARSIIPTLGDFSQILSPAKCAARIGQAFSDTLTSIQISPNFVENIPDIERHGRTFSDGVGTLSPSIMHKIWDQYAHHATVKPTVFQIRFAGAKGMISLDSTCTGNVLRLRKSMIKFTGSADTNIEICGSGIKPLGLYLNAQLIKILEDLSIPAQPLLDLQRQEIEKLRAIAQSPVLAANFLETANLAQSTRMPSLIRMLVRLEIQFLKDDFLRQMVELAVLIKVRELKYRARIPVEQGITLYGIMDETGILQEGQVYCPYTDDKGYRKVLVRKQVVITRSPALHPGDLQLVDAVNVPLDSPLNDIHNCIVFSQHGNRDLPSKLSGGDLDGDLYNIIYDKRLTKLHVRPPADYPRVEQPPLGRAVVREDIIDHFIKFMEQDQLGRIANLHKCVADQSEFGTHDSDCILLAELHSTAVDFSKTGIPVNIERMPNKYSRVRPDFMAPGPHVKVEKKEVLLESEVSRDDDPDTDGPQPYRYYRSTKVLGQLYRAIDEHAFLEELKRCNRAWDADAPDVLRTLWSYVQRETAGFLWHHHIDTANEIKDIYDENITNLMWQYSAKPWKSTLTELEVFIGTIIGTNHNLSRRQKEASADMRTDYNELVEFVVSQIQNKAGNRDESLELSIACMSLAINEEKTPPHHAGRIEPQKLLSFRWIAAAVCIGEVDRLQKSIVLERPNVGRGFLTSLERAQYSV